MLHRPMLPTGQIVHGLIRVTCHSTVGGNQVLLGACSPLFLLGGTDHFIFLGLLVGGCCRACD